VIHDEATAWFWPVRFHYAEESVCLSRWTLALMHHLLISTGVESISQWQSRE
jgi:hypothetical protein